MIKKITNNKQGGLAKNLTNEDSKKYILNIGMYNFDSDHILEKFTKKILPKAVNGKQNFTEEDLEELNKLTLAFGLETAQPLTESVEIRYRGLVVQIKRELECEYNCKKPSERMLVDVAANSFVRKISIGKRFSECQKVENLSNELTSYLNMLSKEMDCAHRQFISAIETLNFIKQPALKVNIKTNNAFVAQNQQFNNNSTQKYENIESE